MASETYNNDFIIGGEAMEGSITFIEGTRGEQAARRPSASVYTHIWRRVPKILRVPLIDIVTLSLLFGLISFQGTEGTDSIDWAMWASGTAVGVGYRVVPSAIMWLGVARKQAGLEH